MRNSDKSLVASKSGAVVQLTLGILLSVTLLLTTLLQMPRAVRRVALRSERTQQQIYDAESALIAHLEGLPADFFAESPWNISLPKIREDRAGPWMDFSAPLVPAEPDEGLVTRSVHVVAGIACDSGCALLRSFSTRRKIYEEFRQQLNREITMVKPPLKLETKSGNRRLFGRLPSKALWVQEGDLTLSLEGEVSSGRFIVDGSVVVQGNAHFDTLRIYARGSLLLRGQTKVSHLEAFSEDRIEISRGVEFSGVAVARREVAFPHGADKVVFRYPSFVMSLESSDTPSIDSLLVPAFIAGRFETFLWSLK